MELVIDRLPRCEKSDKVSLAFHPPSPAAGLGKVVLQELRSFRHAESPPLDFAVFVGPPCHSHVLSAMSPFRGSSPAGWLGRLVHTRSIPLFQCLGFVAPGRVQVGVSAGTCWPRAPHFRPALPATSGGYSLGEDGRGEGSGSAGT